jgi:O-antigen/teichoic acid export membrane protein
MMLVCVYAAAPSLELAASVYLVLSLLVLVTFEASAQEFRVAFAAHVTRRMIQRGAALGAVLFLVAIQSSFPRLVLERQGALEALGAFGVMAFVLQAGNLAASSYGQGMLPQFREATWLQLLRWILVPAGVGILALFAVFAGRDTCLRLLGAQELRGAQDILLALGLTQVFAWPAAVAGCALTAKRMYSFQVFQSALLAGVSLGLSSIVVPRAAAVGVAAVIGFCACLMLGLSLLALWWRERWLKGTERR